jgi:hypothetical protein
MLSNFDILLWQGRGGEHSLTTSQWPGMNEMGLDTLVRIANASAL